MQREWPRLLLSVSFLCITAAAPGAEHTDDTLEVVRKRLAQEKAVLVDVRELREWQAGHLADAQFVPLSELGKQSQDPEFASNLSKRLGKDQGKIVYVHCKSGGRCLAAADVLTKLGCDARPLKAGYADLLKAGFKQASDDAKK